MKSQALPLRITADCVPRVFMDRGLVVWALVGLVCVVLSILPACIGDPGETPEAHDTAMIERNMAIINETGLIGSIKPVLHEVQVNPAVWGSMDYENRKYAASILAQFCGWKNGDADWVELKDAMTGKLLAKYDDTGYEPGS
jgi:hypothetical protein